MDKESICELRRHAPGISMVSSILRKDLGVAAGGCPRSNQVSGILSCLVQRPVSKRAPVFPGEFE